MCSYYPNSTTTLQQRTMYAGRQLAYAPTPYIPRSALNATISLDEVHRAAFAVWPSGAR